MDKRVLKWNFIFQYGYVFTNIINSICLLPLYVKYIKFDLLGYWLATGNILAWLTMADPGIADILQQKIAELRGKGQIEEVEKTIGSGIIATFLIFILCTLIGTLGYFFIDLFVTGEMEGNSELKSAFLISVFATSLTLFSYGFAGINQGLHNSEHVAISFILSNVLFLVINIVLLLLNFSIISIAIANLARAFYLVIHNSVAIKFEAKKSGLKIVINRLHFFSFAKIFSFTSTSKIVMAISNNVDLLLLARYLNPTLITSYEINRRPIKMTQSLVGRYSVALMPLMAHSKGIGDINNIKIQIATRLKQYSHVVLVFSVLFFLTYKNFISFWVGPNVYSGDIIIFLLTTNFFFATLGYFISNMAYSMGDIKANSLIWIVGSIFLTILSYVGVYFFGLIGLLIFSLIVVFIFDFFIFFYRFNKQGFLDISIIENILKVWAYVVPIVVIVGYSLMKLEILFFNECSYLIKFILESFIITLVFIFLFYYFDKDSKSYIKNFVERVRSTNVIK